MCRAHVFPLAEIDEKQLLQNGVRFGKGLQLVNVLRDVPADLRNGRCYLPRASLEPLGLSPRDLVLAQNETRLRPFYNELLRLSEDHLRAGWEYTLAIPRACMRVRLACAWPILIGVRTLARLKTHHVLDGSQRIKISRREVRQIMVRSIATYPSTRSWNQLYERAAQPESITYAQ
jgi:farnesyl-diphosphate farnesyltransferase